MESRSKKSRKTGKYGDLRRAMQAGRAMRTNPTNAAVLMKAVQKSETRLAMKNAGWKDDFLNTVPATIPGTILQIAVIPIGTDSSSRIGAKAKWKSVQIRGTFDCGTAQVEPSVGSILIVYDRYPAATLPTIATILRADSALAMLNDENKARFVVVRRLNFVTASTQQNQPNAGHYMIDDYVKLKGLPVEYTGTARASDGSGVPGSGAIGDIRIGALYCVVVGSDGTSGSVTTHGSCVLNIRTRFADVQG